MKKELLLCISTLLCAFVSFAQEGKPSKLQTYPHLISIDQPVNENEIEGFLRSIYPLDQENELFFLAKTSDNLGYSHLRYQQLYRGVKVDGRVISAHILNGSLESVSGDFSTIVNLNTNPKIQEYKAENLAWDFVLENHPEVTNPVTNKLDVESSELIVYASSDGLENPRLAFKVDVYYQSPLYRADVYVDAHNGEVFFENHRIHHADVGVSANSLYNGQVGITADYSGGNYTLKQQNQSVETYDLNNGTSYISASDVVSNSSSFTNEETAIQAHFGAEQTHEYYFNNHSRSSYDGSGAAIKSYVHYSNNYNNAFWDGSRMTYGDGNGTSTGPLVSLDIVGHEISHGVIEYSANLIYSYESGALNESFADIFGEAIEEHATSNNDWLMGSDIGLNGSNGAIRSMSNPNLYGDPDTYQGNYWYSGSADFGGVHTNSGVQNKWFYILAEGESGTNDNGDAYNVTGIGIDKAADIAYRNLTVYLSSSSNYADARSGSIQAAIDLYGAGSAEVIATTDAWYAVGVGNAYNPNATTCAGTSVNLSITFDNYPAETSWDLKDSNGSVVSSGNGYSNAGATISNNFSLNNGNYTFTIYDSYGDGICCFYGTGSYTLSSGNLTIIQGGSFGLSESVNFCVQGSGSSVDVIPPTSPTNLSSSNVTHNSVDLSWNPSTDNVGVTGYRIYQNGNMVMSLPSASGNQSISGLLPSTSYTYYVTALDAAGNESSNSNTLVVQTIAAPDITAPSQPNGLMANLITHNSIDVSWNPSSDNVGVTGYYLYLNGSKFDSTALTQKVISGLNPSTQYNISISARDAAGNESVSSAALTVNTLSPPDVTAPSVPSNLVASSIAGTSIDISWNPSSDNVGVTGYKVYLNGSYYTTEINTTAHINNLNDATNYSFAVSAIDAAGNESSASSVSATTLDITAPSNPTALNIGQVNAFDASVSWSQSTDNVAVLGYQISLDGDSVDFETGTNYQFVGLQELTNYSVGIVAIDASGNMSGSASTSFTTKAAPDVIAPSTPAGLTTSNITTSSVDLNWNPSTDNVGVDGYNVYINGTYEASVSNTTFSFSGLNASTTYTLSVEAFDLAGNISGLGSTPITTISAPTGPVQLFTHYFETGWDGWIDGGKECERKDDSNKAYEGDFSIKIKKDKGTSSSMTSSAIDVSSYSSLELDFYFWNKNFKSGEKFYVHYYDGSNWSTVATFYFNTDFSDETFSHATVTIGSNYSMPNNAQLRIECDGGKAEVYVDQVTLSGSASSSIAGTATSQSIELVHKETIGTDEIATVLKIDKVSIYPNPASSYFMIESSSSIAEMHIVSGSGSIVKSYTNLNEGHRVDVSDLVPGMYYIIIRRSVGVETIKLIKM